METIVEDLLNDEKTYDNEHSFDALIYKCNDKGGNVALHLDKYLVEKSKESGFNLKVPVVQYQFF